MYALWLLEQNVEVLGVDISPNAIQTVKERGMEETMVTDMFDLDFENGAFRSVLCTGTQIGSIGSVDGIREFLTDLAQFTDSDGVLVLDSNDLIRTRRRPARGRTPTTATTATSKATPQFEPRPVR